MPMSPTTRKALSEQATSNEPLRMPQARILRALMPSNLDDPSFEWPLVTRAQLAIRAGYSTISGSTTRALNGIHEGNTTSGDPHLGVIGKGLVEAIMVQVEVGMAKELNYRITPAGIKALQSYLAKGGKLPRIKAASIYTNNRYLE